MTDWTVRGNVQKKVCVLSHDGITTTYTINNPFSNPYVVFSAIYEDGTTAVLSSFKATNTQITVGVNTPLAEDVILTIIG